MLQCCNKQEENVYIYISNEHIFYICIHCIKSIRIQGYSGPHFPAFRLNAKRYSIPLHPYSVQMLENADQNYPKYGHFLRSDTFIYMYLWIYMYIYANNLIICIHIYLSISILCMHIIYVCLCIYTYMHIQYRYIHIHICNIYRERDM